MGCVFSSIYKEEKVRICKERKKLMKQLVNIRGEFSDSQLAYLKALKNTGSTLRQFTESDLLPSDLETSFNGLVVSSSPPLPLPPSPPPPPPPPFSLDEKSTGKIPQEESLENDEQHVYTVQTQQNFKSRLDFIFSPPPLQYEIEEDENWAETRSDFGDEGPEVEAIAKPQAMEQAGESSSGTRLRKKATTDMHMVVSRNKKLEDIVKELDEYFLKASAGVREITVLIDINGQDFLLPQNSQDQKRNSAKVFSVLSWTRNFKSTQFTRDVAEFSGPSDPCKPGAHCLTLKKLYAAEKKLLKELKEEEITKLEYQRRSSLLQRLDDENADSIKIEKTRSCVESLETEVIRLQQSISETTSLILALIDEELYPQLDALTSGLSQMWRTMHDCHQAQTRICKQLSYLNDNQSTTHNSEYRLQTTIELETEVTYWYNSFCKLVKSQQEYVRTLCKWIQLTNCLKDDHEQSGCSSTVRRINHEQWEHGLDQLPDKVVSEAIKSLSLSIDNIIEQQAEEDNIVKKLGKLETKLEKELSSLAEIKRKNEWSFDPGDTPENLSPHHQFFVKQAKAEALKNQVETEKAKYMDSVQFTRATTLSKLQTTLPQVFQSLTAFSGAYAQVLESVRSQVKPAMECSDSTPQD
ncbi:hypothetical protein L6164_037382 [Bauhinia variegata]|uniref:Uncharacterized protein n=1 Tax=Bauhinia variegata TaxID=167791 RepID=A0ACB9KJX1_BAUVA|nr:hypothetical protein L6164_037382 [Bauhinia variegata]